MSTFRLLLQASEMESQNPTASSVAVYASGVKQDPPMKPLRGSLIWFETAGAFLGDDPALANLMIRIGIAANAMQTQLQLVRIASRKPVAMRQLLIQSSLITSASLTFEALVLIRKNMRVLRPLAQSAPNGPKLLKSMGALMSGKHPSCDLLDRARNQLGFHWDEDVMTRSVEDYARNKSVIWLEFGLDDLVYHRLAGEALTHTLLPDTKGLKRSALKEVIGKTMAYISDAMISVNHFFAICIYAYFTRNRDRVHRRTREKDKSGRKR